jgi:predicted nucleic acid-binding protein
VIAVDSSVWTDLLRGKETDQSSLLFRQLRNGGAVALTDVVFMELLRGTRTESERNQVRLLVTQAEILRMKDLHDFEAAADLYRRARAAGKTVSSVADCMIAVVCIREEVALLHDDADFDRIADVSELKVA